MTTLLRTNALVVGYRGVGILPPVTFDVGPGEFWALIGRNGSGKTTLLRTLLGLLPAISGDVTWAPHAAIRYIGQRADLDLSVPARVVDVVRQGCDQGWSFLRPARRREVQARIDAALQEVDAVALAARPFRELSEGQKQRVLLAQALVSDPALLILDEPTSAMDMVSERAIFALLQHLGRERRLGIFLVGHHLSVLAAHATHLVMVDSDDAVALAGRLEEVEAHPQLRERYGAVLRAGGRS
ncbi:MAG TPA: ATP-binding cassette domain-containing protein [Myxococcota bacterium]|nr:ATP-binding cassette domain-containing protein [Myxococcota bacterium]